MKLQQFIIYERLKQYIIATEETTTFRQLVFRFPNGYGASVVTGAGAYGLEMARLFYIDESGEYDICEEPFGWLTTEELNTMLWQIKETGTANKEETK